ncbi:cytochrome c oxidase assembly protein [Porphyrobacter sp. GA68]|uniref:cytochrome c oxidase assembly protein n=1 Tax=Porphyrobacter sp. GA68 TaxID=2883480 RepID=UPI001D18C0A0|nr:cytochrome c oxidase assembly protein [Porphyrobacter sp. GA68]
MFHGSYCGSPPAMAEIASRWNLDPVLIAVLAGALVMAMRAGNGKAAGGIGLLALAFVSPLCAASVALFSARSIHHLVLILAGLAFALAVRQAAASGWTRRLILPVAPATIAMTIILWAWHAPALYQVALTNMLVYWLMQATILGASFAFWLAVRQASAVGAVAGLIGATVQMGFLGALLTFAAHPLYLMHALAAPSWGLSGLADQQLAGLIMWVGGMAPFAIGGAVTARRAWHRQNVTANVPRATARAL